jgi:F-type H+-transporting ATPase subunit b
MDQILQALGGILIKALPTFFLVILLHFYLKFMFFRPLERVLKQRYDASEGARAAAQASLGKAAQKAAEYEAALREARGQVYQEQETWRNEWRAEQAVQIQEARRQTEEMVRRAKADLAADVTAAKRGIEADSDALAAQIAAAVLPRRAA